MAASHEVRTPAPQVADVTIRQIVTRPAGDAKGCGKSEPRRSDVESLDIDLTSVVECRHLPIRSSCTEASDASRLDLQVGNGNLHRLGCFACRSWPEGRAQSVVVYSSLDREFSESILKAYGRQSGIRVLPKFDVESTKTVGLTNLIIAEAVRPRCDLFWNNEILNTLRLKERGLLVPFHPAGASDLPGGSRTRTVSGMGSRPGPAS